MEIPQKKTVIVTHHGRRSGRPYKVTLWYAVQDGELWLGSLDGDRNWVRNMEATGTCDVDFGDGPVPCQCDWAKDPAAIERFRESVKAKYPIASRVLGFFVRGRRQVACCARPVRQ